MKNVPKNKITNPKVGDIQVDNIGMEWVVVGVTTLGISRVRRNSMAHIIHARRSAEIAKTLLDENPLHFKIPK